MLKLIVSAILISTGTHIPYAQELNYFNQKPPPIDSAVIFAEDIISVKGRWEERIAFTSVRKEVFFGQHNDGGDRYFEPELMQATFNGKSWSKPQPSLLTKGRFAAYPTLCLNGSLLYLEEPYSKSETGVNSRVLLSMRDEEGWGELVIVNPGVDAKEGFNHQSCC